MTQRNTAPVRRGLALLASAGVPNLKFGNLTPAERDDVHKALQWVEEQTDRDARGHHNEAGHLGQRAWRRARGALRSWRQ